MAVIQCAQPFRRLKMDAADRKLAKYAFEDGEDVLLLQLFDIHCNDGDTVFLLHIFLQR